MKPFGPRRDVRQRTTTTALWRRAHLHLDTQQLVTDVEDEVIAMAVRQRTEHSDAEPGRVKCNRGFGNRAEVFGFAAQSIVRGDPDALLPKQTALQTAAASTSTDGTSPHSSSSL